MNKQSRLNDCVFATQGGTIDGHTTESQLSCHLSEARSKHRLDAGLVSRADPPEKVREERNNVILFIILFFGGELKDT